jgi:DNA/RNA endonuclease YhcR with UshA esterase domain
VRTLIALLTLVTLVATAQEQIGKPAPKMSASRAATNLNQTVCVTGKVAQVSIREKLVYVNLDKPFPDMPLTCVIFAKHTNQFELQSLKGRAVEITGRVTEFHEKPQIVLSSSNQLRVVEVKP